MGGKWMEVTEEKNVCSIILVIEDNEIELIMKL